VRVIVKKHVELKRRSFRSSGITVPLGKGFHHTLTISKTKSSGTTAIFKLPKAPFDLPIRPAEEGTEVELAINGQDMGRVTAHPRPQDQTITFDVPGGVDEHMGRV